MFWKKKSNDDEIIIELDEDERRQGIRIQPLNDIIVHHKAQEFKLVDISFMGMAFAPISDEMVTSGAYKNTSQLSIAFRLPAFKKPETITIELHCNVQVIQIRGTTCCCQFIDITPETQMYIEQFILAEQKRQIHHRHNNETIQSS